MNKKMFKYTAIATTAVLSSAVFLSADNTRIDAGVGYRQDSITLNIKERGSANPRAKSNRHFKNIEIVTVGTQLNSTLGCSEAYVRGEFDWGFVVDGQVRDQLKVADRLDVVEFHHSGIVIDGDYVDTVVHNNLKTNSYVWDFDIAFGYPFECGCSELKVSPVVGFSLNHQQLKLKGRTAFEEAGFNDESFVCSSNRSDFRANWWGPYLGFDFDYNSPECWNLYGAFEFHFGRARRIANSHTGSDFIDGYRCTKIFYGPLFRLGTYYVLSEDWYVDASLVYKKYFSDNNHDKISWASGSIQVDLGHTF